MSRGDVYHGDPCPFYSCPYGDNYVPPVNLSGVETEIKDAAQTIAAALDRLTAVFKTIAGEEE